MRRTRDVFQFENYLDPIGETDATASSDDRLSFTIGQDQIEVASKIIHSAAIAIRAGTPPWPIKSLPSKW